MGEPVALTQKTQLVVASQEKDIGIRREDLLHPEYMRRIKNQNLTNREGFTSGNTLTCYLGKHSCP